MNKIYYYSIGLLLLGSSCRKMVADQVAFDVTTEKKEYHVGDTVRFVFNGNPQHIVFYSGEAGNAYVNKDRVNAPGKPELQFTSFLNNAGETNTIRLLASNDFSGKMDSTGIYSANWTDLTTQVSWATTAADKLSGVIDLSNFKDKPLYLAFKYLGYKHTSQKQPKWTIKTFTINNTLPDGAVLPVAATTDLGWASFDLKNPTTVWALPSTGIIYIDGTTVSGNLPKLNEDNEDWAITKRLDLQKAVPDAGSPIKYLGGNALDFHPYIYNKPGTYEVVFVAFNNTIDEQQTVIKKMSVTIQP